jgi:hypothetical protein
MTMAPAVNPADREQIRAAVAARYAGLAQAAQAGHAVTDCDASTFSAGCFGPAGYPDAGDLPDGAVRASLGCGNPVAVADLKPGETVLDLGSGGGIDVLLSARRVGPAGRAYGLDSALVPLIHRLALIWRCGFSDPVGWGQVTRRDQPSPRRRTPCESRGSCVITRAGQRSGTNGTACGVSPKTTPTPTCTPKAARRLR